MPRVVSFVSESVWYVPDVGDNREDPDPFRVLIEPLSARELKAMERKINRQLTRGVKRSVDVSAMVDMSAENTAREILTNRVKQVYGYCIQDVARGGILEPTTGSDLFDALYRDDAPAEELDILNDIIEAVKDHSKLSEGLLEKSDRSLGSSCSEEKPGAGVAPDAAETTRTKTLTEMSSEGSATATG